MSLCVGMARAIWERALGILPWDQSGARRLRAYWDQPEHAAIYAHLMGVLRESPLMMQALRQPWEVQEVREVVVRFFEPDGSCEVEGIRYGRPAGASAG
ncbi:hypothetical protein U7230_06945 [Carboxydochorda subterranea]|uniref:Uncharacterized protein n=1 Tax=Carboxydichorda subterranea TaxID=3109565 RepID=A0ABZ1C1G7_9FIRM|nr:hypothetical protein [Limnochorda sp. L945t]WRP18723.1 hypothetical protein U7230_06945 [Limnochorda sp. L945t]